MERVRTQLRAKKSIVRNIGQVALKVLRRRFVKVIIIPTAVVAMLVLILLSWPLATPVEVRLRTAKVEFIVAGDSGSKPILNQVKGESVAFMKFGSLLLTPQSIEIADPGQYNLVNDTYPDSAWTHLDVNATQVIISGEEDIRYPTVTLEVANHEAGNLISLDSISANSGSRISLGVAEGNASTQVDEASTSNELLGSSKLDVALKIDRQEISQALTLRGPVQLTVDHCQVTGVSSNPYSDSSSNTYRAILPASSPFVKVTGKDGTIVLLIRLSSEQAGQFFYEGVIPATSIKFIQEDPQAHNVSTALLKNSDNTISFPGYSKEPFTFKAPDFIELDEQDQLSIKRISLNPKHKGIEIDFVGTANHLKVGIPGNSKDLRISAFDKVWQNKFLVILFTIIGWFSPTLLAIRKAYGEIEEKES